MTCLCHVPEAFCPIHDPAATPVVPPVSLTPTERRRGAVHVAASLLERARAEALEAAHSCVQAHQLLAEHNRQPEAAAVEMILTSLKQCATDARQWGQVATRRRTGEE